MRKYKYMWSANFKDKTIRQDPEDRYSKNDDSAEWNPTSFRDFLDYFEGHSSELETFELGDGTDRITIWLGGERPIIYRSHKNRWGLEETIIIHKEKRPLKNIRPIYYRKMECEVLDGKLGEPYVRGFVVGYQGLDENGKNRQKEVVMV